MGGLDTPSEAAKPVATISVSPAREIKYRVLSSAGRDKFISNYERVNSKGRWEHKTKSDATWHPGTVDMIGAQRNQYIGQKDRKGKDIYAGDVVRYNTGEVWFVEWDAKQSGFIYMNRQVVDESGRNKPSGIGYGQLPGSHEVEVIGNKYENPELLATTQVTTATSTDNKQPRA